MKYLSLICALFFCTSSIAQSITAEFSFSKSIILNTLPELKKDFVGTTVRINVDFKYYKNDDITLSLNFPGKKDKLQYKYRVIHAYRQCENEISLENLTFIAMKDDDTVWRFSVITVPNIGSSLALQGLTRNQSGNFELYHNSDCFDCYEKIKDIISKL